MHYLIYYIIWDSISLKTNRFFFILMLFFQSVKGQVYYFLFFDLFISFCSFPVVHLMYPNWHIGPVMHVLASKHYFTQHFWNLLFMWPDVGFYIWVEIPLPSLPVSCRSVSLWTWVWLNYTHRHGPDHTPGDTIKRALRLNSHKTWQCRTFPQDCF